jgi:hypothetical protein
LLIGLAFATFLAFYIPLIKGRASRRGDLKSLCGN